MTYQKTQHMAGTYARADKLIFSVLIGMQVFAFAIANWYDTWSLALWMGIPFLLISGFFTFKFPGAVLTRLSNAVLLMAYCALHIHQARGMTEFHFGIFAFLAFLLIYADWKVIAAAAATIAIHHVSFDYLQSLEFGVFCFTKPGLVILLIHAGYVVVEAAVLIYIASIIRNDRIQEFELKSYTESLNAGGGIINLRDHPHDAISDSGKSLDAVIQLLQSTIVQVSQSAHTIHSSSEQITADSNALADSTEEQSISIQRTASSIESLTSSVAANRENSTSANELAKAASEVAQRGGHVVNEVVQTMDSIKDSSRQIVDIISVIDGIAFQTNILALNAAVEAARAGEQGRGFAVVASEVRNLAQRSASAAKEIKALITDSTQRIELGNTLVSKAGLTMEEIVASVNQVSQMISAINQSSIEQATGVEQVHTEVSTISNTVNSNASVVNNLASASTVLLTQANSLTAIMGQFITSDRQGVRR
ncbi:methyl-accepting chemotaxis protein [Undibacterium sp. Ji49W]|uniref:methyl-accepting chemotaxis protein n=1 Tax=Undibacterium sp. Ji49W TaxID=3413040 RepID=UPI003BF2DB0B